MTNIFLKKLTQQRWKNICQKKKTLEKYISTIKRNFFSKNNINFTMLFLKSKAHKI
jgi:hypothetical protein